MTKKLSLSRETLTTLSSTDLLAANGGATPTVTVPLTLASLRACIPVATAIANGVARYKQHKKK